MKIPHQQSFLSCKKAFSLLEVVIAMGIFFMAIFVILELTNNSLHSAYLLKNNSPDPRSLIGDLIITNRLEEFNESGDFGDLYPDYMWDRAVSQVLFGDSENGLFRIDVRISHTQSDWVSDLSMYLFKPENATSFNNRSTANRVSNPNTSRGTSRFNR